MLGRKRLIAQATTFLETPTSLLEAALDQLIAEQMLEERVVDGEHAVGLPALVQAEESIGNQIAQLLIRPTIDVDLSLIGSMAEIDLTEEQRLAVSTAVSEPCSVITGGPGTGKTTVLRTLVRVLESIGERPMLCAPTGRAAKRLADTTQTPASTVHRMLGFRGADFEYNKSNPLPRGTVIVDEASMMDVPLTRRLFDALGLGSRLVFVGDADQLPSVGPGNVLRDVIASAAVPCVRLETIFRQAESSLIVSNAHRIRRGEGPVASQPGTRGNGDFYLVSVADPVRAQKRVLEAVCDRIPNAFGMNPLRDVQVLSPMHRGPVGTVVLNALLQRQLNPSESGIRSGEAELRVGDKVMQIRNDHEREVYNGDIGWIVGVDSEQGILTVNINGNPIEYVGGQIGQLRLAYCVSIHKAQGSEYPAVVIPLVTQHYVMLQRNLLYTAVTRAKQLVTLIAHPGALRRAVAQVGQSERSTLLRTALNKSIHG